MKKTVNLENAFGGKGIVSLEMLLDEKQLNQKCNLYAHATIKPGCSLGFHEHHGEAEAYYILAGKGTYDDNGKTSEVGPGDVTYCPDGSGHAITCLGDKPLEFMALIIRS